MCKGNKPYFYIGNITIMNHFLLLLLACSFLVSPRLYGNKSGAFVNLTPKAFTFEDPTFSKTISEVAELSKESWKINGKIHFLPGFFQDSRHWFKITLSPNISIQKKLYLHVDSRMADEIIIYEGRPPYNPIFNRDIPEVAVQAPGQGPYSFTGSYFNLIGIKDWPYQTYYVAIRSIKNYPISIYVGDARGIFRYIIKENALSALFVGMILLLMVFAGFLYLTRRDKNFLLYFLFTFVMLFYFIHVFGWLQIFAHSHYSFFVEKVFLLSSSLGPPLLTLFFTCYLNFFKRHLSFRKNLRRFIAMVIVFDFVLVCLQPHFFIEFLTYMQGGIYFIFLLFLAVYMMRERDEEALVFSLSVGFIFVGLTLQGLYNAALIDFIYPQFFIAGGALGQSLVFAVALYRNYEYMEKDNQVFQTIVKKTSLLANLGMLTSSIMHEIKTPVTVISHFSKRIRDKELNPEQVKDFNDSIYSSANRLMDLSKLVRNYSLDLKESDWQQLSLNQLLNKTFELLASMSVFKKHHYELDLADNLPPFRGVSYLLESVFINLINNSIAAAGLEKEITIKVKTCQVQNYIEVIYIDDGPGLSKEDLELLFQPFFTKGTEKGLGLGMPIVKNFLELHNGSITGESSIGRGVKFTITIPLN